jgi:hypothetical protein
MQSCIENCNSSICGTYASKNNPITGQSGMVSCPTAYGPEVSAVALECMCIDWLSAPTEDLMSQQVTDANTMICMHAMRVRIASPLHTASATCIASISCLLLTHIMHVMLVPYCANCCRSSATVWMFASTAVAAAAAQPLHQRQHQHLLHQVHSRRALFVCHY